MFPSANFILSLVVVACFFTQGNPYEETLDLERLCIDEILDKIFSKSLSCVNVTEYFLGRIRLYNPIINAVIISDEYGALQRAQTLDVTFQESEKLTGSLHCVPVLVKDNILVKGLPTTLGLSIFADAISDVDAPVVRKLREAGAVILGKANMATLALGTADEASQTGGLVRNPYALNYTAASSSNGNAAALAARLAVIGIASDSFGSVTGPAAVTYTVGFRPQANAFDMSGLLPLRGPIFDRVGLMALRTKDIVTVLNALSTEDESGETVGEGEIKVGILGNITYGRVVNKFGHYGLRPDVQDVFFAFENDLRALDNVSVDVSWDDEIIDLVFDMTKDLRATCSCLSVWMN